MTQKNLTDSKGSIKPRNKLDTHIDKTAFSSLMKQSSKQPLKDRFFEKDLKNGYGRLIPKLK